MNDTIRLEHVVLMTQNNRRALSDVSCRIKEKERVAVCGGSDSGKVELMRLIAGMDKPSSGSVLVLDQAVHKMNTGKAAVFRNRNIGTVQREPGFMERLNVAENVSLPLAVRGASRDQRKKEADELLKMLGIAHVAQAYPAQLSAYETKAACIARALITKPRILLLSEAASRLSERDSDKIIETIGVVAEYGDFTMLWFGESRDNRVNTDRTIQLENGKIREDIK